MQFLGFKSAAEKEAERIFKLEQSNQQLITELIDDYVNRVRIINQEHIDEWRTIAANKGSLVDSVLRLLPPNDVLHRATLFKNFLEAPKDNDVVPANMFIIRIVEAYNSKKKGNILLGGTQNKLRLSKKLRRRASRKKKTRARRR